jgi:Mrp family chromosome partitioning ATPase
MTQSNTASNTVSNAASHILNVANDQEQSSMLSALEKRPPCEIYESSLLSRTAGRCRGLPVAIRRALDNEKNSVVLFTSGYAREGAPSIAIRAARSAASQMTGKVLYIHLSDLYPGFFRDIEGKIPISLNEYLNTGGGDVLPFVTLSESGLVCSCFRGPGEGVKSENLRDLMSAARKYFELIIVGGDNMLAGGASTVFSDLVDGTILVMEAEKTRAPVARKLKRVVEDGGGKVIGAILNRRRHHIPQWIYRYLYGGA